MPVRSLAAAIGLVALFGCNDATAPSYFTPEFGAVVEGRRITVVERPGAVLGFLFPREDVVLIAGATDARIGPSQSLYLVLPGFHGIGAYALQGSNNLSTGYAKNPPVNILFLAQGAQGDVAHVTNFDPQTGAIEGDFSFTGLQVGDGGGTVTVRNGHFSGRLFTATGTISGQ